MSSSPAESIAAEARRESPLWGSALREVPDWEPVFSPLAPTRFALGLETIYEAYLVHYGRPRLFSPAGESERVLLGDYLYAHGLVQRVGAMLTFFAPPGSDPLTVVTSFQQLDTAGYGELFRHLLDRGIYVAPSQYECIFPSLAHGDEEIDATIEAVGDLLAG